VLPEKLRKAILEFQKNELTESIFYEKVAKKLKGKNKDTLEMISKDERKHYEKWKEITQQETSPSIWNIVKYFILWRIFGLTFILKLLERGEEKAEESYREMLMYIPEAKEILEDEEKHEKELMEMIDEKRLQYISSMILGVSDAIVELTGTIAGLTFAFQNSRLVGIAGIITGIAATLSMSVSEYLSQKSELEKGKSPLSAALYTGFAYITAVTFLVLPFFLVNRVFIALSLSLLSALIIIAIFASFISVIKEEPFKKFFFEMTILSFSVAGVSFLIGAIARRALGIEI